MVGDAAHPMLPVGAQAGSQAIVDGRVLAAALVRYADPVEALRQYERERMDAMNGMIFRNRRLGPETVMQLAEERALDGFSDIAAVLSGRGVEGGLDLLQARSGIRRRDGQYQAILSATSAIIGGVTIIEDWNVEVIFPIIASPALLGGLCVFLVRQRTASRQRSTRQVLVVDN